MVKKQVGEYLTDVRSGAIHPADKAAMLKRYEQVKMAIKIARSRANKEEIVKANCGVKLLNFIHGTK
jgi:hypothetical protein